MFPVRSRRPSEMVARSRLRDDVNTIPLGIHLSSEPQHAQSEKRDADNLSEHRLVAMPTNTGVWSILCHKHMLKSIRFDSGERCSDRPEFEKKLGNLIRFAKLASSGKFVLPAERDNTTLTLITVKLELLKR